MTHLQTQSLRSQNPFPERRGDNRDFLRQWQKQRLKLPWPEVEPGPDCVTALCYCFGSEEWISSHWPFFLASIREVWRCCGMLKLVIVSNMETKEFRTLSRRFPGWITIQIATNLIPEGDDDIISMSLDMDANLADRFNTDYVLVFQDDGFPLRPGLEAFLGKCDYYGAPLRQASFWGWAKGVLTGDWRSNGGFSLRSRKLCQAGNNLFKTLYSNQAYCPSFTEDLFFTGLCPRVSLRYRLLFSIARGREARLFSFEGSKSWDLRLQKKICPFGFHSPRGFAYLYRNRILPSKLLVPGLEP